MVLFALYSMQLLSTFHSVQMTPILDFSCTEEVLSMNKDEHFKPA